MRDSDIETLGKVAFAFGKYLPDTELPLFKEYLTVYERLKSKNDREKKRYQEKAEYHREASRQWRKDNKDKHFAYQQEYQDKKRAQNEGKPK